MSARPSHPGVVKAPRAARSLRSFVEADRLDKIDREVRHALRLLDEVQGESTAHREALGAAKYMLGRVQLDVAALRGSR